MTTGAYDILKDYATTVATMKLNLGYITPQQDITHPEVIVKGIFILKWSEKLALSDLGIVIIMKRFSSWAIFFRILVISFLFDEPKKQKDINQVYKI